MNKTPRHRSQAPQRGIAILEVLVSVLLFSLGVLGLIGLQARAITLSIEAEDRNRAALLADEITTAMWLSDSVTIDTSVGGAGSWDAKVASKLPGNGTSVAVVTVIPEATVPRSANITITWYPPQRTSTEPASSHLTTRVTLPPTV